MRTKKSFRKKLDLASGSIKPWLRLRIDYNLFSCEEGGVGVGHARELLEVHETRICAAEMAVRYAALSACRKVYVSL